MAKSNPHQRLTPPMIKKTTVPFPALVSNPSSADAGAATFEPHPTETVEVEVCSELTTVVKQLDVFGNAGPSAKATQRKLALIHDTNGQPIVFSVSNMARFYAVMYVNNATAGWQAFDVTPPTTHSTAVVDAFDTLELGNKVHLVASMEIPALESEGSMAQEVWYATMDRPNLSCDAGSPEINGFSDDTIKWTRLPHIPTDRNITSILCCPSPATPSGFHILLGTAAHGPYAATHYIADPLATDPSKAFQHLTMSGSAAHLLSMAPVSLGSFRSTTTTTREVGVASVFTQIGTNTLRPCSIEIINPATASRVRSYVLQTGKLGSVNAVYSSVNPWGLTDLVVASEQGIGFFEASAIEMLKAPPILPGISFKQAVCSEVYTPAGNGSKVACGKLAIFAVSEQNGLYFVEGTRLTEGNKISFVASGVPIRGGVAAVSPQFNAKTNAAEVLYVSDAGANGLRHLVRDPVTSLWSEGAVEVKMDPDGGERGLVKEPVYMTTITLSNGAGMPVHEGYPVKITCEPPMQVTCNGRSFTLNGKPVEVRTAGSGGQVDLVVPVDELMGSCLLKVQVGGKETVEVDPAQRVVNLMSGIKSEGDLRDARGPNGEVIFADESKIGDGAKLLTNFGAMKSGLSSDDEGEESERTIVAWQRDGEDVKGGGGNWFESAIDSAGRFLGDVIECMKTVVKGVVKFAVRMVGKVVKFYFSIAGKVLSFVLKTVSSLLRSVAGFMKDYLGIDLSGLTKWLQLAFSTENALKTQKVLLDVYHGAFGFADDFLVQNKYRFADWMSDIEKDMNRFLPDARSPRSEKKPGSNVLSKIMNNPVIKALLKFNPLSWILEGAQEGITETFGQVKIPSVQPIIEAWTEFLANAITDSAELVTGLFGDIYGEIQNVLKDPSSVLDVLLRILSDIFYTAFDGVKGLVLGAFDAFIKSLRGLNDLLTGTWKLPGLTDEWEDFAGQEFSLIGCGTYILSLFLNIGHMLLSDDDGLPFDTIPTFDWKAHSAPFVETTKMKHLATQPPGPFDIVVMTASIGNPKVDKLGIKYTCQVLGNVTNIVRTIFGVIDCALGLHEGLGEKKRANNRKKARKAGKAPSTADVWPVDYPGYSKWIVVGVGAVGILFNLAKYGLKTLGAQGGDKDFDRGPAGWGCGGAALLCQMAACSLVIASALPEGSTKAMQVGNVIMQLGYAINWAGEIGDNQATGTKMFWWEIMDCTSTLCGIGGAVLSPMKNPYAKIGGAVCLGLDGVSAMVVCGTAFANIREIVEPPVPATPPPPPKSE